MADNATCGTFQYQTGEDLATAGSRWELWLERFKLYITAKDLPAERIKATFLLMIGQEVYEIYKGLRRKEDDETPEEAYKVLSDHFTAQRSEFAEEQKFRHMKRRQGEPVHDFVMRLRQQAVHCMFGETLERNILSQFVAGSNMSAFQEKCCQTKELKLAKAIEMAQAYESTAHNMNMLTNPTASDQATIMYAEQRSKQMQNQSLQSRQASNQATSYERVKCGYCGRNCKGKDSCPAKGQKCHNCGKPDHFTTMCRNRRQQRTSQPKRLIRHLNTLDDTEAANTHALDDEEYAKYMRFKQAKQYGLFAVKNDSRTNDGPRANVIIEQTEMSLLIDTGAPINVIDEVTYNSMNPKPRLDKCQTTFYGYNATKPLPILGQFIAEVRSSKNTTKAGFIVIEGQAELLLGHKTAVDLGVIKILSPLNRDDQESAKEQQKLKERYRAMFPKLFSDKIGCIKGTEVILDIDPDARPIKQKLRPVAIHLQEAVAKELQRQVDEGILERVDSSMGPTTWISNLVVVPKGDPNEPITSETKVRLTCDARPMNKALRRVRYPTKTMEDLIYTVNGAVKITKLDVRKAFHQMKIASRCRQHTVITTHCGLFRYKRLHMGISSASEEFTECIRKILEGIPGQTNITDDILVFGRTDEEHDECLVKVLARLEEYGITLNCDKCEFGKRELTFFGLRLSANGIAPTESRCQALRNAAPPTNVKELRSLLGVVQFSARFIKDTCTITQPLWHLTKKDVKWNWTSEHDKALDKLKEAISQKHMAFFDKKWNTELIVDASPVGLGAVLTQTNPNNPKERKIICFASRLLSETERGYSQCEKEALAAVWACEKFWLYLIGSKFKLITDNRAVQLIFNNSASRPPARIERWALRLTQFDFEIVHRPGNSNVADYFSRQPVLSQESFAKAEKLEKYINAVAEMARPYALSRHELEAETNRDPELQALKTAITERREFPKSLEHYKPIACELCQTSNGLVLRGDRIVVPKSLQKRVIELAHQGHQGIVKTKALIRSKVWFTGIDKAVEDTITHCKICQANASSTSYAPLLPSKMPEGPWQQVSGDFFGPMPDGTYYFVNHDEYSRWPAVDRIRSTSFEKAKEILDKLFAMIGVPIRYKTDNGPPFNSYMFAEYAKQQGFIHAKVTPRWPRANAEVERFMKNLGRVLRAAKINGKNTDEELNAFLKAYRETPHSTTKVAPAALLFGFSRTSGIPQIETLNFRKLKELHEFARENDEHAKAKMKQNFDQRMRVREPQIKVGARVLLKVEQRKKADPIWDPVPFIVTAIKGTLVTAQRDERQVTRNVSFFKPYHAYGDQLSADTTAPAQPSPTQLPTSQTSTSQASLVQQPQLHTPAEQTPSPNQSSRVQTSTTQDTHPAQNQQIPANEATTARKTGRPTKAEAQRRAHEQQDQSSHVNNGGATVEPRRSNRLKAKIQNRPEDVVSQPLSES
jgi:hypothetical protein